MGLLDFLEKRLEAPLDLSSMSRRELDQQFSPKRWATLDYSERCDCIRELERRLAQEQGRPSKHVSFVPMEDGSCGYWSESQDCIFINDTLVSDDAFLQKGRLIHQCDAPFQLYDTIAHEGYHAYQSYAIENPAVHSDQQQLEEWRLNSAEAAPGGNYENNYYTYKLDRDRYRIQPLERDAFAYGNDQTRKAFDVLEAEEGELPGYQDYLDNCEFNSYENALSQAQRRDDHTLSHMEREMQDREQAWQRNESCGQIGQDRYYQLLPEEQTWNQETVMEVEQKPSEALPRYEEMRSMENPYAEDYEQIVHVRGLNGDIVVRPSKLAQYQEGVKSLKEAFPNYRTDSEENFVFRQEVHQMQNELGYYPELDPRMREALKKYEGTPYEQMARDELGYYPYNESAEERKFNMESLYAEESSGMLAADESQSEAEGESMESLYAEESSETLAADESQNKAEGESMESLCVEESSEMLAADESQSEAEGESMESLYAEENGGALAEDESQSEAEGESMESLYAEESGRALAEDESESKAEGESMESLYAEESGESTETGYTQSSGESVDSGASPGGGESMSSGISQDSGLSQ